MKAVATAGLVIVSVLALGGCMASMTPEQRARTAARLAAPTPQTTSTILGVPRDCDELLRHGEVAAC